MKRTALCYILAGCAITGSLRLQGQTFSLQDCLSIGLENNYSIRISRNEAIISENNVTWGNAGFLPDIGLSAGYNGNLGNTRTEYREGGVNRENGAYDQSMNAGINLDWTVFDGFNITTTYKRLKELEEKGQLNTRISIEDLISDLTAEYYNYICQSIRLKNFRYAVSLSRERLRIVEERYNIGNFSRLDLLQARVDYNEDNSKFIKQKELLHSSRIRLNELMAFEDVDAPVQVADSLIDVDESMKQDVLLASALTANASLLNLKQDRKLAELDLKSILSRNYPYLRINSGYGWTLNKYEKASTSQRRNMSFNAGATIGFTLFDGNRKRERKNARVEILNAELRKKDFEQSLKAEFYTLWQAYLNNLEVLHFERENLIAAKENYEIAMERYMIGDLAGIEMREAQKSLLDAEERILTAEYDTKLCEISLHLISGKIATYLE